MTDVTYQGATLTFLNAIGNSYTAYFSISDLVYSGVSLTTDPSLWGDTGISYIGGNTAGSYLPFGTAGGYLWLADTLLADISEFGPNAIPVLTDLNGNGGVTFTVGIKSNYAYNLYYQTSSGTRLNTDGITGTNISNVISALPVRAPPITYGGDLAAYNLKTTTTTSTTLDIGSTLFSYNTIPLGGSTFSGSLNVYRNSLFGSITTPTGPVGGVTGTLISQQGSNIYANGSASFGVTHGVTFDTSLGDLYMVYYPVNGDSVNSSANYVAIPPISLPFTVGNADFTPVSGSSGITVELKDISYNYTRLSPSQQVRIDKPDGSDLLLEVFNNPVGGEPTVTFTVDDTTAGITASFYSGGVTSRSSYTVPTFIYGQDEFKGTFSATNVTNNGFTINLRNFDYLDGFGHSLFDTAYYPVSPTGRLRITGPNFFFKEVPFVSKNDTYSFVVDSSLPYASSSGIPYTLTFIATTGILPAFETYTVAWPGVRTSAERMVGDIFSSVSGTTVTANVYGIDYLDIYGNSIFSPVYNPIEVASIILGGNAYSTSGTQYTSGGTAGSSGLSVFTSVFNPPSGIPPAGTQIVGSIRGATLTQNDGYQYSGATGLAYFGITGPTGFAASTSVVGSKGDPTDGVVSTLSGTVVSCSDTGLIIDVSGITIGTPNTDPWVFLGSYYNQPHQGHTGSFQLINSAGVLVNSVPHVQGVTGITLISGSRAIASPYTIAFNDATLGRRRDAGLTFSVIQPVGSTLPAEQFVGTITDVTSTSFTLNNFNYLQYGTSIVYGASGQTGGYISLYAGPTGSSSAKLFTTPVLGSTGATYSFTSSTRLTPNAYLEYSNTANGNNFYGTDYKQLTMSSSMGGPTFFGPWTAAPGTTGYTLLQGLAAGITANARIGFDYMYTGAASESIIYTLIAEVDVPIPTDQVITVKMPAAEMARMLLYQSAWTVEDPGTGLRLQGYVTAGVSGSGENDPASGVQTIDNNGNVLSGPNVALLLGSVLNAVNYSVGGDVQGYPVLSILDNRFTSINGTPFVDDAGVTIQSIRDTFTALLPQLTGTSTGPSLLSLIPAETIAQIENNGLTITSLVSLLKDIDTLTNPAAAYVPALSNIFAESAAYGKTDDTLQVSAASVGATGGTFTLNVATAESPAIARRWAAEGINVFGTNFQPGDSITLYVTYEFSKGRKYVLDPFVVQGLQANYNFAVGNVLSLKIGGRSVNLKKFNTDGSVDLGDATGDAGDVIKKVIGIKLLAMEGDLLTGTVFRNT